MVLLDKFIAHRGLSLYYPENTMTAFEKAYEAGFSSFETDITILKDNTPVLFHDYTFKRLSGLDKIINNMLESDINKIDIGSLKSKEFSSCRVPLLKDLLIFAKKNNIKINLELKGDRGMNEELWDNIVTQAYNMVCEFQCEDIVFYSSFEIPMLRKLKSLDPNASFGILLWDDFSNWQILSEELKPVSIHFKESIVTKKLVREVLAKGYKIYTHTVNDEDRAKELFSFGVNGIFSDHISKLK